MRRLLALLALLALAGCATPEAPAKYQAAVEILSWAYGPNPLEIAPDTRVTFTNRDGVAHTVTPDDAKLWGTEGSGMNSDTWIGKDQSWAFTFREPGTFTYYCIPHPNMTASVVVR